MKTKLQISLTVIIISMLLISCVNSGKKNSEQSKVNEPIYELNETFLKDYRSNQVGADNKYKNKLFRIKGNITEFSNFGGPTVHVYVPDVDGTALCHFDNSKSNEVGKLQGGQKVVIEGIFTDMITSVNFQDCVIKEAKSAENN